MHHSYKHYMSISGVQLALENKPKQKLISDMLQDYKTQLQYNQFLTGDMDLTHHLHVILLPTPLTAQLTLSLQTNIDCICYGVARVLCYCLK